MSFVIAAPELMTSAATDLSNLGSNLSAAHKVAAAPTVAVAPAAADEVSAGIARVFSQHAQDFQAAAAKAATFHEQFAQNLNAGAFSYTSIENAISSDIVNAEHNAENAISSAIVNAEHDAESAVGAYLLGNLGLFGGPRTVGLLPQLAYDFFAFTASGSPLGQLLLPLDIPLVPLLLLYAGEGGQAF
jgi:hypothetical protein